MECADFGYVAFSELLHPLPGHARTLAATPKGVPPGSTDLGTEHPEPLHVLRHHARNKPSLEYESYSDRTRRRKEEFGRAESEIENVTCHDGHRDEKSPDRVARRISNDYAGCNTCELTTEMHK